MYITWDGATRYVHGAHRVRNSETFLDPWQSGGLGGGSLLGVGVISYEEFTRLAETRLAQNTFNYLK